MIGRCLRCPPRLFWPSSAVSGLSVFSLRWEVFKRWKKVFEQRGTDTVWFFSESHVESLSIRNVDIPDNLSFRIGFSLPALCSERNVCPQPIWPTEPFEERLGEKEVKELLALLSPASQDVEARTPHYPLFWGQRGIWTNNILRQMTINPLFF